MFAHLVVGVWSAVVSTKGYECARTAPFHPNIHNMGNVGALGRAHAQGAWFATRVIDALAYRGRNMRSEVARALANTRDVDRDVVLEIGCGVGTLTAELMDAGFQQVVAMDTSAEMLEFAKKNVPGAEFHQENGVDCEWMAADVAIACMVFHEMPQVAHREMIRAMARASNPRDGEVWIVDIDPSYEPSVPMLAGEPYVPSYLKNIEDVIAEEADEEDMNVATFSIVSGHVRGWVLSRT